MIILLIIIAIFALIGGPFETSQGCLTAQDPPAETRESIEVRESTRAVLGDIQQKMSFS